MNRIDVATEALKGVFATERAGGADASMLCYCLRLVVGAYATGNIDAVRNGLEVDAHARGFSAITQKELDDARYRGMVPNPIIERARREIRAEQKAQKAKAS